jgi:hypothetical protein
MSQVGGTRAKRPVRRRAKTESVHKTPSVAAEITMLLNTLRELAAIRATAEDAAARILDSAEGLMALADKEEAEEIQEAIMTIMAACGFHDLVGQRVTKISKTLDRVIATRLGGKEPATEETSEIDGPTLPEMGAGQDEIDALFREN